MHRTNIHLHDFPEKKIVVFLEKKFREELIDNAIHLFAGRKKLIKYLGIKKLDTVSRWKRGKINRGGGWITPQGIPLDKLKKLSDLFVLKGINKFQLSKMEKHVVAYKTKGKSLWVKKPRLPLKIRPRLFRIIAHMIGDGSAEENNTNYFKNFNEAVCQEFVEDIRNVFGNVELTIKKNQIIFPIVIRHIISKALAIQFGTFNARVPKILFDLPQDCAANFVQGFCDDEGTIGRFYVRFYSSNIKLLSDLRNLLIIKFPEINAIKDIKMRKRLTKMGKVTTEYNLLIGSRGFKKYYDLIGCNHSLKRRKFEVLLKSKIA